MTNKNTIGEDSDSIPSFVEEVRDQLRSRRALIGDVPKIGASAAALGTLGAGTAAASNGGSDTNPNSTSSPSDVDILNYALTLEHLEAAYYDQFLAEHTENEVENSAVAQYFARPTLQYSVYQQIQDIRDHEQAHVDALIQTITDLGGVPVEAVEYEFPYSSIQEFVALSDRIEAVGVSAYAGVAPMIDDEEVLKAALSIHSVEANHQTYFQLLNLQRPAPNAFNPARSMEQVHPIARQFIVSEEENAGGNGLVTAESDASVVSTVEELKEAISEAGLKTVATLDHAKNAASVGMDLRPTTVIIFGNPKVGTPLMQASQTTGIDLPQKLLVYEDTEGQTTVVYNSSQYLTERHDISGETESLEMIGKALKTLAGGDVDQSNANANALLAGDNGIATVSSDESVSSATARIQKALESADAISVVATIDHAANAASVGLDLRPTALLLFGNPNLGTPLMQADQAAGIDLPQKFLVFEDASGAVHIAYNDPQFVAKRHGITGQNERLLKIESALRRIAMGEDKQ